MPSLSQPTQYNAILNRDPFANLEDFLLAWYVEDLGWQPIRAEVQNLLAAGK